MNPIHKKGEEVTIIKPLTEYGIKGSSTGLVSAMKEFEGKKATIVKIEKNNRTKDRCAYKINIDNEKYWWSWNMFEQTRFHLE